MTSVPSLATSFDPRRNSLNALRLVLALLVIVSHTWPLGGYGSDPGVSATNNLGQWAVAGFFAISGYLITASRLQSRTVVDFLWRRVIRIYPAFLVSLVVVAFGFAPFSLLIDRTATWSPAAALAAVGPNLGLYMLNWDVAGTLRHVPFPRTWNGSLWTLAFEFVCYLIVGAVATVFRGRRSFTIVVIAIFGACTLVMIAQVVTGSSNDGAVIRLVRLLGFFCAGAIIYIARERIPSRAWIASTAGVVVVGSVAVGWFEAFAGLPMAYLLLYLGARLPLTWLGYKNDISYGMYIYAFPLQQLLVLAAGAAVFSPALFALLSALVTIPFAWASWLVVERPAMRWKRLTARKAPDPEGPVLDGRARSV